MSKYISFHNHDCLGSLLDSTLKIEDLVKWAKANNMSAVGTLNHGELTSVLELRKECKKQGIKPIIGYEAYLTENKCDENGKKIRDNCHICLIAKNEVGYNNLLKLHNMSWREDRMYYDPRITLDDLLSCKDGLIVTSACIGGVLGKKFTSGLLEEAEQYLKTFKNAFGDDFYLELHKHQSTNDVHFKQQEDYNRWLMNMSKRHSVKCIVQQDAHYYLPEHHEAHQVLLCKNTNSKLSKPTFSFESRDFYLKNEVEMLEAFNEYPLTFIDECFANTKEIADKIIDFEIANKNYTMPTFGPKEITSKTLRDKAYKGLYWRFGNNFNDKVYLERIEYELSVIDKLNMQDYVLMLDDIYSFARNNNIYTPVGRGSMGASLVFYCLNIVQLDPVKYNLMFERFCSPDRISMMDADSDWAPDDKPKIEKYIVEKYGVKNVCGISTYNQLTAKSAFKAVASVLEIKFDLANRISSLLDSTMSLKDNYEQNDTFRCAINNEDILKKAYEISLIIEGTYSSRGQHPCASVIFPDDMDKMCPCVTMKDPNNNKKRVTVTSYNMKEVDGDLKFLKLDNLGLRNIQIIREADKYIKKRQGINLNFHNLDINDKETYKNLSDGNNLGVFQFESTMFKGLLKDLKPKTLEDIATITALGRPSALQSGLTEQYKKIRHGEEQPMYLVPELEEVLGDTYGIYVFQESMMLTMKVYAGFTNSEADVARKICGKKLKDKIPELKKMFMDGAKRLNRDLVQAEEEFEKIQQFASYGFSKIHALLYGYMSFATAYYKTHYPHEYMTSLLNSVTDDLDKLNLYISECYRLGIPVLPPDINESDKTFTLNNKGEIRFGLNAIKGLGASAVTDILKARSVKPFESLKDFIERTSKVDRSNIQSLLRVGAFDNIQKNIKRYDKILDYFADVKNSKVYEENGNIEESTYIVVGTKACKKSGKYLELVDKKRALNGSRASQLLKQEYTLKQEELINAYIKEAKRQFLQFKEYSPSEKINNEKELMGFNISINPYKRWSDFKKFYIPKQQEGIKFIEFNDLVQNGSEYIYLDKFNTVALLSDIKEIKTKKGRRMAKLTFEYYGVKCTATVFQNLWENNLEFKLKSGNMVSIVGRLEEANKQYNSDDYEISLYNIRQLNVLVNENNKCIIEVKDNDIDKINEKVSWLTNTELKNNLPIEKCVIYKIGDKYKVLCGLNWVNDTKKLTEIIY